MSRRRIWAIAAGTALMAAAVTAPMAYANASASETPGAAADNPYGDPNLVSMFDGKTLDGWTQAKAGQFQVQDGTIHSTGSGRGWIYYKQQAGSFRWIFNVKQVKGNHAPTVLIWGTTSPLRDALSAIQFQPPNGGHWDYRPGHNNGGGGGVTPVAPPQNPPPPRAPCGLIPQ